MPPTVPAGNFRMMAYSGHYRPHPSIASLALFWRLDPAASMPGQKQEERVIWENIYSHCFYFKADIIQQ